MQEQDTGGWSADPTVGSEEKNLSAEAAWVESQTPAPALAPAPVPAPEEEETFPNYLASPVVDLSAIALLGLGLFLLWRVMKK